MINTKDFKTALVFSLPALIFYSLRFVGLLALLPFLISDQVGFNSSSEGIPLKNLVDLPLLTLLLVLFAFAYATLQFARSQRKFALFLPYLVLAPGVVFSLVAVVYLLSCFSPTIFRIAGFTIDPEMCLGGIISTLLLVLIFLPINLAFFWYLLRKTKKAFAEGKVNNAKYAI